MTPKEIYRRMISEIREADVRLVAACMEDKKYCSYCKYSNFDTGYFPPRFTCTLYKERITKDERARTCPDYKPIEKVEKR